MIYDLRRLVSVAIYSFLLRVDALEEVLALLPLQLLVVGRFCSTVGFL